VRETPEDLARIQELLDRSYARAGPHLLDIHTPDRRLRAEQLVERLEGMCLLALATVTADGRPLVGPVDGVFYRGAFHFSSGEQSFRYRHIHRRPQVSATHVPSEQFAVTVHGRGTFVDIRAGTNDGLRQALLDVYTPRYGADWVEFLDSVG
jgi:uncharacterized pyridoxamine 5'-phosphate oxidase family protein